MELLRKIFDLRTTIDFISVCEEISNQNPNYIRNGLGVNFSDKEIESVKLYYGFTHKLKANDIEKLHFFGKSDSFYKKESRLKPNDYCWDNDLANGVSFALKVDKNLRTNIGYFMLYEMSSDDPIFQSDQVIEYYSKNNDFPFLSKKGEFTIIDEQGKEHTKDYYYVTHPVLKEIINRSFCTQIQLAPTVEWILGKGFYDQSDPSDEKIVLLGNYETVYQEITKKLPVWNSEKLFSKWMFDNFKCYPIPMGLYKNNKIRSIYYYDYSNFPSNPTLIEIISKIQNKLNISKSEY